MRRVLFVLAALLASSSVADAAMRSFSFGGAKESQSVSLEVLDRFTVRLAVVRPSYQIEPIVIRLSQPITMDRPNAYRFAGETSYAGGTLRVRGRWLTQGTPFEGDDMAFVSWTYTGGNPQDRPGDDYDDEILDSEDDDGP